MPQFSRFNAIDQLLDVAGSESQNNVRLLTDETGGLGHPVILNSGTAATITAFANPNLTVAGLTGQSATSVGTLIALQGAGESGNDGVWRVNAFTNATTVVVTDAGGYFPDANSGSIRWEQYNSGNVASITTVLGGIVTITGLQNMTANSVGNFITISGAATGANNGTFLITAFLSATSVSYANAAGVAPDGNNGAIVWTERLPYSLNDDLDFERSDRTYIKGVNYDQPVPNYTRPDLVGINVPTNLQNIAGKTTDAKLLNTNRIFYSAVVAATNTHITISSAGNLKHASATDNTGIPCFDVAPYVADFLSSYVFITNSADGAQLVVQAGPHAGELIFAVTKAGASVSPNSVEVWFYSVPIGGNPTTSATAYTWEATPPLPTSINLTYGFGLRLDNMDLNALRSTQGLNVVSDGDLRQDINDLQSTGGWADGTTNLSTYLTNTGANYVFFTLPGGAGDTVVSALNALNFQIGDRNYTGTILTSGQTITASLQALSNAISNARITRTIERLAASVPANTSHLLPGGLTYTLDGTFNGNFLFLYWRGILRDPGSVANGDDYQETNTSHFTPYSKINANDHINYFTKS